MCRLLKRYGHTRKKIREVALWRMLFCLIVNHLCGLMKLGLIKRIIFVNMVMHSRESHQSITAFSVVVIDTTEVLAVEVRKGSVNGDFFYDYLRGELFPKMHPFPGPNSVAIMDNCSIHHVQEVKELAKQLGIVLLYLPPYSPDRNPIEELFSYVKNYLRKHDELLQAVPVPTCIINAAASHLII